MSPRTRRLRQAIYLPSLLMSLGGLMGCALLIAGLAWASVSTGTQVRSSGETGKRVPVARCGALPVDFLENRGQWPAAIKFGVQHGRVAATFEPKVITLRSPGDQRGSVRLAFESAAPEATVVGEGKLPHHYNFFHGNDPARWRTDVAAFGSVRYRGLYKGVEVLVREESGRLAYDLMLAPEADLQAVVIRSEGTKTLEVAADGALVMETASGKLRQTPPNTWEVLPDGTRRAVECRFRKIDDQHYGFAAPQRDRRLPLVIDPGLEWGTYLGGSNAEILEAVTLARDGSGDIFVGGYMNSPDFPGFSDPNFTPFQNKVFVARLSGDGSSLRWATSLGGWSSQLIYRGLAAAPDGGAALVGENTSPDFPTTPRAFDRTANFKDAFVVRLSASGGLVYSSLLGGSSDDTAYAVGFDPTGAVVVGGNTASSDFPTTPGAFDRTYNAPNAPADGGAHGDIFITRFSLDGSAVTYSTFLGGPSADVLEDMVVDSQGFVTLVGWVTGNNVQTFVTTADAFDRTWNGSQDAILARLKLDGAGPADLKYATLIGGANQDNFFSVKVDPTDPTLVTAGGMSWSDNFPVTPGVFKTTNPRFSDLFESQSAIVTRFRLPAGGPNALVWSTYLGPPGPAANIRATDVAVSAGGQPIVVGLMGDGNYPTTQGAFDRTPEGILNRGGDFIARLSADASQLIYSSFFGGTGGDQDNFLIAPRAAYVGGNTVVVAGTTTSADFPVTSGAFDTTLSPLDGAGSDGFVMRFTTDPNGSGDVTVGTPTPLTPSNGATFPSGTLMVRLQWSAVSDASGIDGYEFQTSGASTFANPTPGVSHIPEIILPPTGTGEQGIGLGTWYWRVRAYDRAGNIGAWSSTSSFTLDAPAAPPSVTFAGSYPATVVGGGSAVGAVYLDRPAPPGGLTVVPVLRYNRNRGYLAPNLPIPVAVPASITVPGGAVSAEFPITTSAVPSTVAVDIITTANGVGPDTILTVTPPGAVATTKLVISPATVSGGHPSTGTITIERPAPPGGLVVSLRTSHPQAAQVPASVTVPAGSQSATFPITTFAVPFEIDSYVDAYSGSSLTRQYIFVKPGGGPTLTSFTLSPPSVSGGTLVTGTITFNGVVPFSTWPAFDDARVSISCSDPNLVGLSPFVTVLSGTSSATFQFTPRSVPTNTTANLIAAYDSVTLSAPLTVSAGPAVTISSVTLNVTAVTGGQGGVGFVNLGAPAPQGGIAVTVSASDPVVYFNAGATVFISEGSTNGMLSFLTQPTSSNSVVSITARYGASNKSASLTVNASTPASNLWVTGVTVSPSSVQGGGTATGTATINAPAASGGAVVQLSTDLGVASVPASVTIPAGATSANFTITTASVSSNTQEKIWGLLNISQAAVLTITPPPAPPPTVSGVSLSPSTVVGGSTSTGTVTLSGADRKSVV